MTKQEYAKMNKEYRAWIHEQIKGEQNYRDFSYVTRTLEFAKHWNQLQLKKI